MEGSVKNKIKKKFTKKISGKTILAVLIFTFLLTAPFYMSSFRTNLLGKYMCFALIVLGIDMIWGYTGILSLGHGVYFGLGAYCMAMHLKLEASGNNLPDFMSWSGMQKLPIIWEPFKSSTLTLILIVLVPVALAAVIGYLTFINRIKGVYFSILSQALSAALATLLIGMQGYFGGSNGLTNYTTIFGYSVNSPLTKLVLFYVTFGVLLLSFILCSILVKRRVGKVLIAIRDSENRARFTGYNPATYKVFVYCLSAALAGIAGALYVPQVGIISPYDVNISPSIEMVIWAAIGGKGTLIGPILGALLTNSCKSLISESFPQIWSYFIGVLFIVSVLFLPNGLISLKDVPKRIKARFFKNGNEQETEIDTENDEDTIINSKLDSSKEQKELFGR
ncbi:urea ABC transporter permease subunit UrtC [Clostridium butyricum]|uniref:urea ABC transporter permease subunit UrtC n=1 Tax=Clostridium butyricum TaxID=1492 RepID=UPI00374EB56B